MTLIISVGNSENFIQVSDLRLSSNGKIVDDDSNKIAVFVSNNGRFAVGFTGLAKVRSFETQSWLANSLCDCGPPDFDTKSILERFAERTTFDFQHNQDLKFLNAQHKRLSIMFTGYLYHHSPPLGALALVSNFENLDDNSLLNTAKNNFRIFFQTEPRPNPPRMKLFHKVGMKTGDLFWQDFNEAIDMAVDKLPAKNIELKLVSYIRKIAKHPSYCDTVGEQILSVIIPCDRKKDFLCSYYPISTKIETYMPNLICAINHEKLIAFKDIKIDHTGLFEGTPIVGPILNANQRCWCGSKKKFKHCHGSKQNRPTGPTIDFNALIEEILKNKRS